VARTMDRDPKHLQAMLIRANQHKGASFLEIYQNCNIFNDGAFEIFTEKGSKAQETLFLEQGKPLLFGPNLEKGIKLDGFTPKVVTIGQDASADECWIHDEKDMYKADRPCYEDMLVQQIDQAKAKKPADLDKLLRGNEVWTIN